jgi:hypothetical protein
VKVSGSRFQVPGSGIRSLLLALAFLTIAPDAHAQDLVVGPYLQSATPTDIWILWETSAGGSSRVEWGSTEVLGESATGSTQGTSGAALLHEVQITGLSPATTYHYRVSTGDLTSETFHFRTPPLPSSEADFRLVAMSDMQIDRGNPTKFAEVIDDGIIDFIADELGGDLADELGLVLVTGDLVDDGWVYDQWVDDFFGPAEALLPFVPIYPVLGNHESNADHYFRYFHLPDNDDSVFAEAYWTIDYSNVRIVGLDSNAIFGFETQLIWLSELLDDTCDDDVIDFVFAQLHHPWRSELWVPGELGFTGEVVALLEAFTTACGKPSIHFFGHTHGYSRGQSRDHAHLMVNVATAGGNIDYWGEYEGADYDEFTVSQPEYGFVLVEVEAGDEPSFRLRRVSRGDETTRRDNDVRDEVVIRRYNTPPGRPQMRPGLRSEQQAQCVWLAGEPFDDADGDLHGATHWQVSKDCGDFSQPVYERWAQHENWYFDVDTQAGDDLTDQRIDTLTAENGYCWRFRYRDRALAWSDWSEPENLDVAAAGDDECSEPPIDEIPEPDEPAEGAEVLSEPDPEPQATPTHTESGGCTVAPAALFFLAFALTTRRRKED